MSGERVEVRTLAEICVAQGGDIQTGPFGSQLHASDYSQDGTPVVMPVNIFEYRISTEGIARVSIEHVERLEKHILRKGDIVFSRRGDVTRFAYVGDREDGWLCGTGCIRVRVGEGDVALPEYVAYALASSDVKAWLVQHAVGATMPHLNTHILGSVPIPLPSLRVQRAAVEILSTIDARIDVLRAQNATLEAIAQAIFDSWFINFDPVHAKAAGREPGGMDAETAALFPSEFEDSELGPIPKGWTISTVGKLFEVIMGQSPPGSTYNEEGNGVPFFQGRADFGFRFPRPRVYCTAPTRFAKRGDVLLSVRAPVGDINVALDDCSIGRGLAAIRCGWAPSFALYTMKSLQRKLAQFETEGTVFGSVSKAQLTVLPVVSPPANIVQRFEDVVSAIDERIRVNEVMIRTLSKLRDTLLPPLISGRLRVPEAENMVQEAVS